MSDKLVANCPTGKMSYETFTTEEITQKEQEKIDAEQQSIIDALNPSQVDIDKANRQINLVEDLTELGVI